MSVSAKRWIRNVRVAVARGADFGQVCRDMGRAGGRSTASKRRAAARVESLRCGECGFFPGSCDCSAYAPTVVDVINAHANNPGPLLR